MIARKPRTKSTDPDVIREEAGERARALALAILELPHFQEIRRQNGGRGEKVAAARLLGVTIQTFSNYYHGEAGMSPAAERLCTLWLKAQVDPQNSPAESILDQLPKSRWNDLRKATIQTTAAQAFWRYAKGPIPAKGAS